MQKSKLNFLAVCLVLCAAAAARAEVYRGQTSGFYANTGTNGTLVTDATAIGGDAFHVVTDASNGFVWNDMIVPAGEFILAVRARTDGSPINARVYHSGGFDNIPNWSPGVTYEAAANRWHVIDGEVYGFQEVAIGTFPDVTSVRFGFFTSTEGHLDELLLYSQGEGYATEAEAIASLGGGTPTPQDIYRIDGSQFAASAGTISSTADGNAINEDAYVVSRTSAPTGLISAPVSIAAGTYVLGYRARGAGVPASVSINVVWPESVYTGSNFSLGTTYVGNRWFNIGGEAFAFQQVASIQIGNATEIQVESHSYNWELDELILFKAGQGYATEAEALAGGGGNPSPTWSALQIQMDYSSTPVSLVLQGTRGGNSVAHVWRYTSGGSWESTGDLDAQAQYEALTLALDGAISGGQTLAPTWNTAGVTVRSFDDPAPLFSEWVLASVALRRTTDPTTYAVWDNSEVSTIWASSNAYVRHGDPMADVAWRLFNKVNEGADQ